MHSCKSIFISCNFISSSIRGKISSIFRTPLLSSKISLGEYFLFLLKNLNNFTQIFLCFSSFWIFCVIIIANSNSSFSNAIFILSSYFCIKKYTRDRAGGIFFKIFSAKPKLIKTFLLVKEIFI